MALCNAMIGFGKALRDGVGADGHADIPELNSQRERRRVAAAELLTAGAVAAADCCGSC